MDNYRIKIIIIFFNLKYLVTVTKAICNIYVNGNILIMVNYSDFFELYSDN
jgi:hypothetical protein